MNSTSGLKQKKEKSGDLPLLAVTMGDPAGIGPEIISLALEDSVFSSKSVVVGDLERLREGARRAGSSARYRVVSDITEAREESREVPVLQVDLDDPSLPFGKLSPSGGDCAYRCIIRAIDLALNRSADAVVTAPINKESLNMAGHVYPGHTELLAHRTNARDTVMMLAAGNMRVLHVTTHIRFADVPGSVTRERIERVLDLGQEALTRLGIREPRFAVAGLNPHSGESGIFGDEEEKTIKPAITSSAAKGINVDGPIPPDVVFLKMHRGQYDAVIAMYHDQGHIPLKLLAFESGVNVTLGLPIVRTSVDHGTAFDIAGKGLADPGSLIEALRLALILAGKQNR